MHEWPELGVSSSLDSYITVHQISKNFKTKFIWSLLFIVSPLDIRWKHSFSPVPQCSSTKLIMLFSIYVAHRITFNYILSPDKTTFTFGKIQTTKKKLPLTVSPNWFHTSFQYQNMHFFGKFWSLASIHRRFPFYSWTSKAHTVMRYVFMTHWSKAQGASDGRFPVSFPCTDLTSFPLFNKANISPNLTAVPSNCTNILSVIPWSQVLQLLFRWLWHLRNTLTMWLADTLDGFPLLT